MKRRQTQSVLSLVLLLPLILAPNTALLAQTAEWRLVPTNEIPQSATFASMQLTNVPPLPWNPYPQLNAYAWSGAPAWIWVDDRLLDLSAIRQQRLMNRALRSIESQYGLNSPDDLPPDPGGWEGSGGDDSPPPASPAIVYPDGSLWVEPVSVTGNRFNALLHGATSGSNFLIISTGELNPQTNSAWQVEGSLQGGTNDATPFTLGIATRTNNLFIRAQACDPSCASTALPLAWQFDYFGVTGVDPGGLDPLGYSFLDDWINGRDPNVVQFSLFVAQQYINSSPVPVQLSIVQGVPSFIAVLINDTNVSWQPFTSTNLSVPVPADGTYVITVGLCGLATNATPTWRSVTVVRDSAPLMLALTNLAVRSGSRPFIDPAGYASRALKTLNWTVVDASDGTTSGSGAVVALSGTLADGYHLTNWFQCVDLALALGTNWISIQAADRAGNVATTNFFYVFDTNGDITPPALTMVWPQNRIQVSGDSLTIQAWTDDDTANVALQYTDTNGTMQTVSGLVERGGNVWVNVPLAADTNGFNLVTTDAAGNASTIAFIVVRSSVDMWVVPLSQDQMQYGYATVMVAVIDPDCTEVTVNGVQGTNNEYGYWEVDNVPLPAGGAVTLQAAAQFADGRTVQTLLEQERGPVVFTQTYNYKLEFTMHWGSSYETHYLEAEWTRGVGGTSLDASAWGNTSNGMLESNGTVMVWPPDNGYLPILKGQVGSFDYHDGVLSGTGMCPFSGMPPVEWMEQSASTGSWPDYGDLVWSESSGREVRLFTGGLAKRHSQALFDLSAALTVESEADDKVFLMYWLYEFGGFLAPGSPQVAVPSPQISLCALGTLGSDGHLPTMQPDGIETAITPNAPGSNTGSLPAAPKYKLRINWQNGLGEDIVGKNVTTIVGQKIVLTCDLFPDGPIISSNYWTIPGDTVKRYEHYLPQYDTNTYSIIEYPQPTDRKSNSIAYYWINGGANLEVSCTASALGATWTEKAHFTVNRPVGTLNATTTTNSPPVNVITNLDGSIALQYGTHTTNWIPKQEGIYFSFGVTTPTNGAGSFGYVQRVDGTLRRWQLDDAGGTRQKMQATNVLDFAGAVVDSVTAIGNSDTQTNFFRDSPALFVYYPGVISCKWASGSDSFTGWLVYKPAGDAIWVTLRELHWSWSGGASKDTNGVWTLSSGYPPPPANPSSQESTDLPTWNGATLTLPILPDN